MKLATYSYRDDGLSALSNCASNGYLLCELLIYKDCNSHCVWSQHARYLNSQIMQKKMGVRAHPALRL